MRGVVVAVVIAGCSDGADGFGGSVVEIEDACDLSTPWPRRAIATGLTGADAVAIGDIDGDGLIDAAGGWEWSLRVTVSINPGIDGVLGCTTWPTIALPVFVGTVEDVALADVDRDGRLDVISATESSTIHVHFAPTDPAAVLDPGAWTAVAIEAAAVRQRWMQVEGTDIDGDGAIDILAGSRGDRGSIGYFTSATPRDGATWFFHHISPAGWTMSVVPRDVDKDGDRDVVASDRAWIATGDPAAPRRYDLMGSRWLENTGGEWINHTIYHPTQNEGSPKFLAVVGDGIVDGTSSAMHNLTTLRSTADWATWSATPVPQPDDVGQYHAVAPGDLDGDGRRDLVFTYSDAGGDLPGIIALRDAGDGTWAREDIGGPPGSKFDEVVLYDLDGDGDLDAITTEQTDDLGVVWYENPR